MSSLILFLFLLNLIKIKSNSLTIGNYNVWNYMFSWEIRFQRIAKIFINELTDIITLQEIYSYSNFNEIYKFK